MLPESGRNADAQGAVDAPEARPAASAAHEPTRELTLPLPPPLPPPLATVTHLPATLALPTLAMPVPAADAHQPAVRAWRQRTRTRRVLTGLTGVPALVVTVSVIGSTVRNAWRHRVLGLSAEAGFWQLLSLPAALLGVLGTIGYFAKTIGQSTVNTLEQRILDAAGNVINPSSVNTLVKPTVDAVLHGGRAEIVSVGFLLSLWSGSSAIATYINTISIAYGQREGRSAVRSRLLALAVYIVALIAGVAILPLLVVGPTEIDRIPAVTRHHNVAHLISVTYWPIVGGFSILALASLYRVAPPRPARWRAGLPGALVAACLWFGGSIGLRSYVTFTFRRTAAYGALGAPVAVLLFFYITALAVLLGAELNAEIGRRMAARLPADPRRTVPA